jgi:hypothetical protein
MITKKRALLCCTTAVMALFASENGETLELVSGESANSGPQEILLVKENGSKAETPSPSSKQSMKMIDGNSSALKVSGVADCNIGLDFIYWQRTSGKIFLGDGLGLSFATGSEVITGTNTRGQSYQPNYGYEPGIRALLGIDFQRDGWDLEATYTWVKWNVNTNYKQGTGWQQTFDYFQDNNVPLNISSASDSSHTTLNLAYLTLGRKFYTSEWMLLRPNMGLAFTYIPHSRTVSYNYVLVGATTVQKTQTYQDSGSGFGGGMVVGLDTEWRFHPDWSFLGNISFTSVYTGYSDNSSGSILNKSTNVSTQNLLSGVSMSAMQFIPALFIGIDWHTTFYTNNYVCLHAGWDFLSGFKNFSGSAVANTLEDDFGMQGFQLGGMVQF